MEAIAYHCRAIVVSRWVAPHTRTSVSTRSFWRSLPQKGEPLERRLQRTSRSTARPHALAMEAIAYHCRAIVVSRWVAPHIRTSVSTRSFWRSLPQKGEPLERRLQRTSRSTARPHALAMEAIAYHCRAIVVSRWVAPH